MSDYNLADELMQNTAVYTSLTFEEIVMVMICKEQFFFSPETYSLLF